MVLMSEADAAIPRYLTVQEMAAITGFPVSTIRAALQKHEMAAVRAGRGKGGAYRVRREEFERWLREREEERTE